MAVFMSFWDAPHLLLFTVPVVKATWAKDAEFLEFYSDVSDASVPTVSLGVANTERGDQGTSPSLLSCRKMATTNKAKALVDFQKAFTIQQQKMSHLSGAVNINQPGTTI